MHYFIVKFISVYTSQRVNVCINCTEVTNESKSNGALNNPWRWNPSVETMTKWEKNDAKSYLHCNGGRWSLRLEDQSQRNKWNITRYQVWNITGTCLYPVHPYLKNKSWKPNSRSNIDSVFPKGSFHMVIPLQKKMLELKNSIDSHELYGFWDIRF